MKECINNDLPEEVEMKEEAKSGNAVKQQHHAKKIIKMHEVNKKDKSVIDAVIKDCMHKDFIKCKE